ncbi:retinal cone rhodopsin-sensitive cGMP 3',5'-cyclic phosphodiesterase subunit gamma-like [Dendropsophus ebraccatus]|uniref:retinal cone rhodopsin-sensitive cGMP 3',5'-cyclic phosphodiesterase subunit gamma-like n=1 Tax=Dendropsophus ebraccatus TaxID=150705 RepID=UPI0038313BEF
MVEAKEVNEGENAEQKPEEVKKDEGGKEPEKPEGAAPKETKDTLAPADNNPVPPAKLGPTPKKAPKFKQRATRQFKSKPPKKGVLGFGDDIPGMDGLGTDITVICPWEAFSHLELHELAQYGII